MEAFLSYVLKLDAEKLEKNLNLEDSEATTNERVQNWINKLKSKTEDCDFEDCDFENCDTDLSSNDATCQEELLESCLEKKFEVYSGDFGESSPEYTVHIHMTHKFFVKQFLHGVSGIIRPVNYLSYVKFLVDKDKGDISILD